MNAIQKIRVIGHPFAAHSSSLGAARTPVWLSSQQWFKNLKHVEYEQIQTEQNELLDHENILKNSMKVKQQTYQALKDGYYPLVLGGDSSLTVGTISALKQYSPQTKTIWVDSILDMPQESEEGRFKALEYLTGFHAPTGEYKCMDLTSDVVFVGSKQTKNNDCTQFLQEMGGSLIGRYECMYNSTECVHDGIHEKLYGAVNKQNNFWISVNLNCLDTNEFQSKTRRRRCYKGEGLPVAFLQELLKSFGNQSIGMNLSSADFEVEEETRAADEETFRHLFELTIASINAPSVSELQYQDAASDKAEDINMSPGN